MNYLKFSDLSLKNYLKIFKYSNSFKKNKCFFYGKRMIMLFRKPSTRTRISFEMSFKEEGGKVVFLNEKDTQLSRGESLIDTLKTLSYFCDILVIRTFRQDELKDVSKFFKKPIINALTNESHPCQVLADIYTLIEKENIKKKKILWVGEKNNVFKTWYEASKIFNFKLEAILPLGIKSKKIRYYRSFKYINRKYLAVISDTWNSMGCKKKKKFLYKNIVVKKENLKFTKYFLHCLPAYIGKEIDKNVLNDKKSLVWKCIQNKRKVYKGIIHFLLKN
ncbi:hypothetical protein ACWNYO_00435 [Candidatus Vidania fulgoroideorum]